MKADVYKKGVLAATLTRGNGFTYLPEYLAGDGPAVATSLPKTDTPVWHGSNAIPPFFAGLLPEGNQLIALKSAIKAVPGDQLTLLLAVGQDTRGDVQVVPAGSRPQEVRAVVEQSEADLSLTSIGDAIAATDYDRVALPGGQGRWSLTDIFPWGRSANHSRIMKINPPGQPHTVANEAACLKVAARAKLNTTYASLERDRDGLEVLICARADRPFGRRVAMEDATQVMGLWPADKYKPTYEEVTLSLVGHAAAKAVARMQIFRQVAFAWLIGSDELHAKNLTIVESHDTGEWVVGPISDVTSKLVDDEPSMALSLAGQRTGINRRTLLSFADGIDLPRKAAEAALDSILRLTAPALTSVASLKLPYGKNQLGDWQSRLDRRRRELTA